jgi:hypothetical protein
MAKSVKTNTYKPKRKNERADIVNKIKIHIGDKVDKTWQ